MYEIENGEICSNCNGSGEGYSDGSNCIWCKGSGMLYHDTCECCGGDYTTGNKHQTICSKKCNDIVRAEFRKEI